MFGVIAALAMLAGLLPATAIAQETDPRIGLGEGWLDAEEARSNLELLAHVDRPEGFFDADNIGSIALANSDVAFTGDHAIVGSFHGFNIYDISTPDDPTLTTSVVCPGGQGDPSVFGDLLFISVEETRSRIDCGTEPATGAVNPDRFRGVRIFDISDLQNPVQVAAVQTCRGSHTHTLVTDPNDDENLYVYVSGTAGVRSELELEGCNNDPATAEDPSRWRIEVIQVPLAAPDQAEIVNQPRLFTDPETGAIDGLQNSPPTPQHPSGMNWGPTPITDACHDITAYPEIGLAAGACEGNGILIDISDAADPTRVAEVADPNFAYWHSATLSNDGTKVVFTDEWGGGLGARCRTTDEPEWGADAIFDIVDGQMEFASYYKLPVPQTTTENCVAHNASLIPVPGRDIMAQAWYQGGLSVFDFTDSANPVEIAFFDRGPISSTALTLGGLWSTYWYNGHIFGTEIARGFDVFALSESEHLSQNELDAAAQVRFDEFNAQLQPRLTWEPSFTLVRAYRDQLERAGELSGRDLDRFDGFVDRAEQFSQDRQRNAAKGQLDAAANQLRGPQFATIVEALRDLADSL